MIDSFDERIKIFGMSDNPLSVTGYANQSRELFKRLARRVEFDTTFLGCQYFGQPSWVDHDTQTLNMNPVQGLYKLLPRGETFGAHPYCDDILPKYLKDYQPDLFWVLLDTFMVYYMINMNLSPSKFCMWFPSDGQPLPWTDGVMNTVNLLKKAEMRVAMSKFAQEQAVNEGVPDVHYIPLGTDTTNFYPLNEEQKMACREEWSKRLNVNLTNKFIVGSVARFQGRKMTMELLKVFRDFCKNKTDALLLLHCSPTDPAGKQHGYDIVEKIKAYGIQDKVVFSGMLVSKGHTDQEMNQLFNMMDVHALTTSGEGFGIPTIEAQACNVPTIATDFTTTNELVVEPRTGLGVKLATTITGTFNVERGVVDKKDFVEKLNMYYKDESLRQELAKNCRPNCVKKYDFEKVVYPAWVKLIKEEMNK